MQTTYEKVSKFVEVAHQKYDTHAYAVGYFGSMVSGMIDEMRQRGTKDTLAMADYYDRLLSKSITKTLTEK
jgi:hypothetical protein